MRDGDSSVAEIEVQHIGSLGAPVEWPRRRLVVRSNGLLAVVVGLLSCCGCLVPETVSVDDDTAADDDATADDDDTTATDGDGDGFTESDGDCDDDNPQLTPEDVDGDGWSSCDGDCDDGDAGAFPGGEEIAYDGVDQDCDGEDLTDLDGDGFDGPSADGPDCDDTDPNVHPGAAEACNGRDDDCSGALLPDETDVDADGWMICEGDCDDGEPYVYPGAPDVCDAAADNDCDGSVDPLEADGDGDGYSECGGDCDVADATQNPGADEVCNSEDDNCDGVVDEETAVDATTWYRDFDGDLFGDPDVSVVACVNPGGYVDNDGDCDDTDADMSPVLSEWFDGKDNDCDGLYDNGVIPAGAIVITEVMTNPWMVADGSGEWFELFNTTGSDINLIGADLYDLVADATTVDGDLWVPSFGYAVLGNNGDVATNGGVAVDYEYSFLFLGNGADQLYVEHGGHVLDFVEWDGGVDWPDPVGASMSLEPAMFDIGLNDDGLNWCEGEDPYGDGDLGTPAADNPGCCWDLDGDGYGAVACGGMDCDDTAPGIFPGAEEICDGIDNDCDPATDELADGDGDQWAVCDGDCDGNDAGVFPGSPEVYDGKDNDCNELVDEGVLPANALIITEIMQNSAVVSDDFGEWFEVYNNTAMPMNLRGVWMHDDGSNDHTIASDVWIDPGMYAPLGKEGDTALNGGVTLAYVYEDFTLGNSTDEIYLWFGADLLDSVIYDDGVTFPDPNGATMSLDIAMYDTVLNDDGANWCFGVPVFGDGDTGTPGADNESCACMDLDGDGHEDMACGGMDCDDEDPAINPDAAEICGDLIDNDCDSYIDYVDWDCDCEDVDGDGYDAGWCGGSDCDDTDPDVSPGMAEDCANQIDDDCDGAADAADADCPQATYYLEQSLAGVSSSVPCPSCDFAFDVTYTTVSEIGVCSFGCGVYLSDGVYPLGYMSYYGFIALYISYPPYAGWYAWYYASAAGPHIDFYWNGSGYSQYGYWDIQGQTMTGKAVNLE